MTREEFFKRVFAKVGNFIIRRAHLEGHVCKQKGEYISDGSIYSGHGESSTSRPSPRVYKQSRQKIKHSIPTKLAKLMNDDSDNIGISQPPLLCRHSPPRSSVADCLKSRRHTDRDYVKIRLEKEILKGSLFYESSDDESSVSGDCERVFSSSQQVVRFVAKVNPEESECAQPSTNLSRKDSASKPRTAAHEINGMHVHHCATAPGITVPKNEIHKFSWNPMEYGKFTKAFQMSAADQL
ncbi:hypothetical protein T265_07903 [Opisthorchis viverrini]|uniref:Uncharacterized protein n=1 Tax=Opisthorchis viverrini TaxID=6198 RepID=A0A074ZFL0_OPIVI|nr:hypothetical protein T265_07903 [Opisthorchis viverrini]KER24427.1 hypothetical protein T265_07903 [Opisthorchis viverrini]